VAVEQLGATHAGLVDEAAVVAEALVDVVEREHGLALVALPLQLDAPEVTGHGRTALQAALGIGLRIGARVQPLRAQPPGTAGQGRQRQAESQPMAPRPSSCGRSAVP
jgi:hypothetical protein